MEAPRNYRRKTPSCSQNQTAKTPKSEHCEKLTPEPSKTIDEMNHHLTETPQLVSRQIAGEKGTLGRQAGKESLRLQIDHPQGTKGNDELVS
jgi:hypothetical protein